MPTTTILNQAKFLQNEIVFLRRHLHANPELSFEEYNTAKMSAERLVQHGYKVRTGIGKTGVLGHLGTGVTVAIRADMDALPIQEVSAVEYKSKKPNVMHACGHDAHVSCVLTAAQLLSMDKQLPGRARILLQPSEETCDGEGKSGARRMIEDGAIEDVSAIVGLHMDASLPAGQVGIIDGAAMAAADCFKITITGKGGHGAYPETTVDAVLIASHVVTAHPANCLAPRLRSRSGNYHRGLVSQLKHPSQRNCRSGNFAGHNPQLQRAGAQASHGRTGPDLIACPIFRRRLHARMAAWLSGNRKRSFCHRNHAQNRMRSYWRAKCNCRPTKNME